MVDLMSPQTVLTPADSDEMLRAWQLAGGDPMEILNHPAALAIVLLMFASLGFSAWREARTRRAARISAPAP